VNLNDNKAILQEKTKSFDVSYFQMAKYLITNKQYALFMQNNGYDNRIYWTDTGWRTREKHRWTEPAYWHDPEFNADNQPVTGISWYEAHAFTRWLSNFSGQDIRLPTEQQWQRAAQGNDNRKYAWGYSWEDHLCQHQINTSVSKTASVTKFKDVNKSPFGVVDMTGNLWEWCLNNYDLDMTFSEAASRSVRGGSWYDSQKKLFHVTYRGKSVPENRKNDLGLRCVNLYLPLVKS
jgi:formylglycine-generating enzyme required for sulfatase activity